MTSSVFIVCFFFFFNDTATTEIYTLSLHDALPISGAAGPAAEEVMAGAFRFLTAGESHGEALVAVIDGVPAGLSLAESQINADLARRQRGYGRGGRMEIGARPGRLPPRARWGLTLGR